MSRPDWMNDAESVRLYQEAEGQFPGSHARGHQLTPAESAELAALLRVEEPTWFAIDAYVCIGFFIELTLKPGSMSTSLRSVLEAVARSPAEAVAALQVEGDQATTALEKSAASAVRVLLASTHDVKATDPIAVFELAAQMQAAATRLIADLDLKPRRGPPLRNGHLYDLFAGLTDLASKLGADLRIPGNAWADDEGTPFSLFADRAFRLGVERAKRVLSYRNDVHPLDHLGITEELDRLASLSSLAVIKAIREARKAQDGNSAETPE